VAGIGRLLIGDELCQFEEVMMVEWRFQGCNLIEGDSQTPDVNLLIV
jgi:hypothetical protein